MKGRQDAVSVGGEVHSSSGKTSGESTREVQVSANEFVRAVLGIYISLPDTPQHARRDDRYLALKLYRQGIQLYQVEGGLLLATARRVFREEPTPLEPVRSLRYFVGAIEEVCESGVDESYTKYIRGKLEHVLRPKSMPARTNRAPRPKQRTARQLCFEWEVTSSSRKVSARP